VLHAISTCYCKNKVTVMEDRDKAVMLRVQNKIIIHGP
jgi:hypothetical protein